MTSPEPSPLGDTRNQATRCQECGTDTWNHSAVCDACRLERDPRVIRARAITDAIGEGPRERQELVQALRAEGVPMAALARALGVTRQRLYAITTTRPSHAAEEPCQGL